MDTEQKIVGLMVVLVLGLGVMGFLADEAYGLISVFILIILIFYWARELNKRYHYY